MLEFDMINARKKYFPDFLFLWGVGVGKVDHVPAPTPHQSLMPRLAIC